MEDNKGFKVFRDPIYDLITIDRVKEKVLLDLIDLPEFQRLKNIKQLGFTYYTYPSATHTRFTHCIGVSYLAGLIFDKLPLSQDKEFIIKSGEGQDFTLKKSELRLLVKIAGLLHDIGHGPFSHAWEEVCPSINPGEKKISHEKISVLIIKGKDSNVRKTILGISEDVVSKENISMFPEWLGEILTGDFRPLWVKELITSQLDADRIDYLMRDSHMCGVKYTRFDLNWFLNNLNFKDNQEESLKCLAVNAQRGIYSIESFIISRYHMYWQVYFHKTTRAFEKLFVTILEKASEHLENKDFPWLDKSLPNILKFYKESNPKAEDMDQQAYQMLDDSHLITQIKIWSKQDQDPILKDLSSRFIDRKHYKLTKEFSNDLSVLIDKIKPISEYFKKINLEEKYFSFQDKMSNLGYKDTYATGIEEDSAKAELIWLKNENKYGELTSLSRIINSLRNQKDVMVRYYVHEDHLENIKKILDK